MKKALFIDRDGTLVIEPPIDYQLDSLEKLAFYPGVFRYLSLIAEQLDYELVMVSNQDGLGTQSFPENTFWPAHNKILQALENEGVEFHDILIDRSFPGENLPTRKPGTAMLKYYMKGEYNLEKCFVIGDRDSDMELAKNLGAKGIFLSDNASKWETTALQTTSWKEIYHYLISLDRTANYKRKTKETEIEIELNLEGSGQANIHTGLKFFDHMLEQIAKHGLVDLKIQVKGDLEVDEHHTVEDTAIALGKAFKQALANKLGIERYGFYLPMDDCLAQVALDFGGRNWLVWDAEFYREKIGDVPTEMFYHFFKSFSDGAEANLNIKVEGENEHHKIESIFKAFAKAIKMAIKQDKEKLILPSTKGML